MVLPPSIEAKGGRGWQRKAPLVLCDSGGGSRVLVGLPGTAAVEEGVLRDSREHWMAKLWMILPELGLMAVPRVWNGWVRWFQNNSETPCFFFSFRFFPRCAAKYSIIARKYVFLPFSNLRQEFFFYFYVKYTPRESKKQRAVLCVRDKGEGVSVYCPFPPC